MFTGKPITPALVFLTLIVPTSALAGAFECVVKQGVVLNYDGELEQKEASKRLVGHTFTVVRESGLIQSSELTNRWYEQGPTVYDYEPDANAYKAISIYKPNPTVDYLTIHTHEDQALVPFMYHGTWGVLVTGLCIRPSANKLALEQFEAEVKKVGRQ